MKKYLPWILVLIFVLTSIGLTINILTTKIHLAYESGVRNAVSFQDCFGYRMYYADALALKDTVSLNCQDLTLLIKEHKQEVINNWKEAKEGK